MPNYRDLFSFFRTPQDQPVPGKEQERNRAAGYVFALDDWARLDRFLILGSDAPTYYASARELTQENAAAVVRCLAANGPRVVARIVEISDSGRAPRNEPALFALAMASSPALADAHTRQAALEALPRVARTGTHLLHFANYVEGFRGWGRGLRNAVAGWYNNLPAERLAYQVVKYQQRDGWSHRDLLRVAHPEPASRAHDAIFHWLTQGKAPENPDVAPLIAAYEQIKVATMKQEVVRLIGEWGLTREMVPTEWLNEVDVWEALLADMPLGALLRNLGKMSAVGLLQPMGEAARTVSERLRDGERIQQARLHPLAILVALNTYRTGSGFRGSLAWQPVAQVIDALDEAFYLAFGNVEATGRRIMLALDVSGSMAGGNVAGMTGITPRAGSAAMALVTARTEPHVVTTVFSDVGTGFMSHGRAGISSFPLSARQRLDDVVRRMNGLPFAGTDCALPMLYALENRLQVDAFIVYTDNETWAGQIHPFQALQEYRHKTGIPARLVVVGMTSNGFSIADPDDGGMLDVVGFDTAVPALLADFIRAQL